MESHQLMKGRMRIGVKYCGGCNPTYERVEMIQRVRSKFKNQFHFIQYDQKDLDGLVLMNGCSRACAAQDLNRAEVPRYSVTEENDFRKLMDGLIVLKEKGKPS
jgi:hypothetical protein